MIIMNPTKNLAGINIQGDYYDFSTFVDAVYRLTGTSPDEDYSDPYYAVQNRLLGICYDIRHAYQGDRDIVIKENGLNEVIMDWHDLKMSEKTAYFSVNILFPEAIFVAAASENLLEHAAGCYGKKGKKLKEKDEIPYYYEYTNYVKDCAVMRNFSGLVWGALGDAIGEVGLENILKAKFSYESYADYAGQFIDKCDISLLKTKPENRPGKLKTLARRIVVLGNDYYKECRDIHAAAKVYGCSIHEIEDPHLVFPDEIDW